MKTKSLLLGALLTLGAATASAGTKVFYQQNFETVSEAADAGWTSPSLPGGMSITSDDYGKYFQFSVGGNNGRSTYAQWGSDIYGESAPTTYTMVFDFCMATAPNNQYSSNIAVFTDQAPKTNSNYASNYSNYLIDLTMTTDANTWYLNGDDTNTLTLTAATWYKVTLNVDATARTVDYEIITLTGENVTSGTRTVAEGVSMYAEGLHLLASRYQSVFQIDNIKISAEIEGDFASDPTVALTRLGKDADGNLNLNLRGYTITFNEGETLYVTGTDGATESISYTDCDGSYSYETSTSGTLTAWTVSGDATSNKVETTVDCSPCVLPTPTLTVSSVTEGYGKTYTVTIDNSNTPLSPQIFYTYTFTPEGGTASAESEENTTGSSITVTEKGTITITTKAFGYQSAVTTVSNDVSYALKEKVDFARMDPSELTAKGYTQIEDLNSATTSGESNWTARYRLYYWDAADYTVAEDGTESGTKVYPFGYTADGSAVIHRYQAAVDETTSAVPEDATTFGSVTLWSSRLIQWNQGIGVLQNSTGANYNTVTISNLSQDDVVVINTIDNYGGDSNHPVCSSAEEYYAQLKGTDAVMTAAKDGTLDETTGKYSIAYSLYRIQTALVYVSIYGPTTTGISNIKSGNGASDVNAPYYTIGGVKVSKPTQKGIYIHNGKKLVVK